MTEDEKFLFDLNGYLIVENILTEDEIALTNEAIDRHEVVVGEPIAARGSKRLKGKTRRGGFRDNPLRFERPWCEPFRRMLVHPKVIDIFNEILGPGFRLDHGPSLIEMKKGTEGHRLHGGMTFDPSQYHHFINGRVQCGLCVATWYITEVREGDGGFACIPGSHKLNYEVPLKVRCVDAYPECVRQLVAGAGSLIIFNEALVHGTLPWQVEDRQRRSILYKCSPGFLSWGQVTQKCPIADPTEEEKAIFEPPHRARRVELHP